VLLAAVTGCGVPFGAPLAETTNTCSATSDCASTGAACVQGACVATSYDLTGLQIEVRPATGATFGANTSFIVDPAKAGVHLASGGRDAVPFLASMTVPLPPIISIHQGKILFDPSTQCAAAAQGVAANITLYRSAPFDGFAFSPINVSTTMGTAPTFDVDLVPDVYDIYVVPQPIPGCAGSPYPPVYMRNVLIDAPGAIVWTLPAFGTFNATIAELASPSEWNADVVEPNHGLTISSRSQLGTDPNDPTATTMTASIAWADPSLQPILRLQPKNPERSGSPLPSLYWDVGPVFSGTMSNAMVNFTAAGLAVHGVNVEGVILGADGTTFEPAQLSFQSTELLGTNAHNAAFSAASVLTDPAKPGRFSIALPPGNYTFQAVPTSDAALSVTNFTLDWPSGSGGDCVCGLSRKLARRAKLSGSVLTPTGQPLAGAFVRVAPSATTTRSYLADTHMLDETTRDVSTTSDAAGDFDFLVDLGHSDLTVQPDPSTKMPWLVHPRLGVSHGSLSKTFTLTTPAFLSGTVLDPSGMPVVDAVINAWLPVRATDGNRPGTAVQIATASTDSTGAFSLVLPSSL